MAPHEVYLLWWDNGLEYADHEKVLLGVYLDKGMRRAAKARYALVRGERWPLTTAEGKFHEEDVATNADLC